jgi:ribosomal protein S12 methylthiotransferase
MESIEREARTLAENGAKELVIIAQDTSKYGIDLYGRLMLPELLRRLCRIDGIEWIRILYGYPDGMTDELLRTIAQEEKVVPYIDLPLQHCNSEILHSMRRGGSREQLTGLIAKMRSMVPGLVLRTTLIAGYPGETEGQFDELCSFVREIRFERLGCFAYSQEEGTAAAELPDQIDKEEKQRRAEFVMEIQMNIMQENGEKMAGRKLRVLTEGFDRYAGCWFGRSYMDSPDVDGKIYFHSSGKNPVPGQFETVKITGCVDGDLTGETVG